MLKSNTLPDIFKKDKKKKNKRISYYIHKETTNKSFLKLYALLSMLGIENNTFFLALYDKKLKNVDPFDENLDKETQARVLKEVTINPWYFLRECVLIPVAGAAKGKGKRYEIHRGNLSITFCMLNNLNSYTELPRQVGKSIAVDCLLLWLYNFGTSNSQMMIMNKQHADAKDNLDRILRIREVLPEYLRFDTRIGANGKRLKLPENKEFMKHHMNNNELVTKPQARSKSDADRLGRGCTQPTQWFDEFGFLNYNDIIYKSASPAVSKASEEAALNHKPYGKIITSTPGDIRTEFGRYAYGFIERAAIFHEEFYDWTLGDIKEYVNRNSKNDFLYIKFSYKQLGKSQAYFDKQVKELDGDMEKVRREVLLHWNVGTDDSPFDKDDIEELEELAKVRGPIRTLRLNKYYMLDIYEEIDFEYPSIISVDVAAGHARDSSAIAVTSSRTKRILATFLNNKIDPTNLSALIYTISKNVFPNSVICIERNNAGEGVISNLKHTDIKHKLYFEVEKRVINEKVKNGQVMDEVNFDNRKYGVWTDNKSREKMYDLLIKFVQKYKSRIAVEPVVNQIKTLAYIKDRIDHMPGFHDDLLMAYLIGMYAYYYGGIQRFGIIPFPDFEEDEEKMLEKYEKEKNKPTYDSTLFSNEISDEEDDLLDTTEYKTLNDYYSEIDKEREYYRGRDIDDFNFDNNGNVDLGNSIDYYKNLYTGSGSVEDDVTDQDVSSFLDQYI